jgi:LuxR family maltose regulon positive regulatory protein
MEKILLATKTFIPVLRDNLVERKNLFQRLNRIFDAKFALISAPAGYGKTTLIRAWSESVQTPVAWVSIDQDDNDLSLFFRYLTLALLNAGIQCDETLINLIQPNGVGTKDFLYYLMNVISEKDHHILLVLDDYHRLVNSLIQEAVQMMIDICPPNFHLIIGTRIDPFFTLSKYRVSHQIIEIRADELRFNSDEISAFFDTTHSFELTEKEIEVLEKQTEGWCAGLHLAALALKSLNSEEKKRKFLKGFDGNNRYIMNYLSEETLDLISPEMKAFLLKTSILQKFNDELCFEITGLEDSRKFLSQLFEMNIFIVPLDLQGEWFRYHNLFSDLLRSILDEEYSKEIQSSLHHTAARWYAEKQFFDEAIYHAIEGTDFEFAVEVLSKYWRKLIKSGLVEKLLSIIKLFPTEFVEENIFLGLCYAWAWYFLGNYQEAEFWLARSEHLSKSIFLQNNKLDFKNKYLKFDGHIYLLRSKLAWAKGQYIESIKYGEFAVEYLDKDPLFKTMALNCIAKSVYHTRNWKEAKIRFEELLPFHRQSDNLIAYTESVTILSSIYFVQAKLDSAFELNLTVLQEFEDHQMENLPFVCLIHDNLSELHYIRDELDKTEKYIENIFNIAPSSNPFLLFKGLKMQVRLFQALGYWEKAERILKQMRGNNLYKEEISSRSNVNILLLRQWIHDNDSAKIKELIESLKMDIKHGNPYGYNDLIYINYAAALIALNEFDCMIDLLKKRLPQVVINDSSICVYAFNFFIANGYYNIDGDLHRGYKHLLEAVEFAAPIKCYRTFLDFGVKVDKMLCEFLSIYRNENTRYIGFVEELIKKFDSTGTEKTNLHTEEYIGGLTSREKEILLLICAGHSNQEIAESLFISLNTVKRHITHLYEKLNVKNRTQAILLAQNVGPVEERD